MLKFRDEPEIPSNRHARHLRRIVLAAALITAVAWSPTAAAQPSPSSAVPRVDPLLNLCDSVGLDELEQMTGLPFATATPGPHTCTYASEIGAEQLHSLDLRIDEGSVAGLEEFTPGGQRLEVAGRPAYWAGSALWTDFGDGLFTVQPLVFEPGVDLLELALPVAELALSRIGPPLVDASGAFTFEELEATPAACYGDDAWTDEEGHRISGLPVTMGLTVNHLRDMTDQLWLIVEGADILPVQPTLIDASWPEASWSYPYGENTVLVPGPTMTGTGDQELEWELVLRSVLDVPYEVHVTAGPPSDPRPDDGTLDAIVRAPDLARWERLVSASFC
jgi:hypothetical protein